MEKVEGSGSSSIHPVALVTGASAGLGAVFAERLAQRGYDLILVARRRDRLVELQRQLSSAHGVRALVLTADLAEPGAAKRLYDAVQEAGWNVDLLVNNAGFGHYGPFMDQELADLQRMCAINVASVAELAHLFGRHMRTRKSGAIINVASGAAFIPTPLFGLYGATKAFVLSLSQSLSAELEEAGVQVLCVCPGATATEFHGVAVGKDGADNRVIPNVMTADAVVDQSLAALARHDWVVVPGFANKVQAEVPRRLFPGRMAARIAMKKMKARIEKLRGAG